jgi:hypothetical protein
VSVLSFCNILNHNEFEVEILCLSASISSTPVQILKQIETSKSILKKACSFAPSWWFLARYLTIEKRSPYENEEGKDDSSLSNVE